MVLGANRDTAYKVLSGNTTYMSLLRILGLVFGDGAARTANGPASCWERERDMYIFIPTYIYIDIDTYI